jgi:hypothetical protein
MNLQLLTNAINKAKFDEDKFYFSDHVVTVSFTPYEDQVDVHEFLYKVKNNWQEIEPTKEQIAIMLERFEYPFESPEIIDRYDYYGVSRKDFY